MKLFYICYGRSMYDYNEQISTESVRLGDNYPTPDEIAAIIRTYQDYTNKTNLLCWAVIFTLDLDTGGVEIHLSHKKPLKTRVEINVEAKKSVLRTRKAVEMIGNITPGSNIMPAEILEEIPSPWSNPPSTTTTTTS